MADIGCDHGKLTAVLAASGRYPKVIGADLRPGPLSKARQTLEHANCQDRAELRLGDGLSVLSAGEVGSIVLAGVSAQTTWEIIEKAPWVSAVGGPRLVMVPTSPADNTERPSPSRSSARSRQPAFSSVCFALASGPGRRSAPMTFGYLPEAASTAVSLPWSQPMSATGSPGRTSSAAALRRASSVGSTQDFLEAR